MDNIKEVNGVNIENIGKLNAVTKGYFKNKNGVSFERYPYDTNHIHVYRMIESSGTTVKDYVSETNGTATSGLAIDTGYGINKKCRSWTTGIYKIDTGIKITQGAKTIRFKIYLTAYPVTNFDTILDTCNITSSNVGTFILLSTIGKITFGNCFGSDQYAGVDSNKGLSTNTWYDIMLTSDGTTNANGLKIYIKALTGTDSGKWYDSSNVAQSTISINNQGTSSFTSTAEERYNVYIGNANVATGYNLENTKLQDFQISNIARTDMKEYI